MKLRSMLTRAALLVMCFAMGGCLDFIKLARWRYDDARDELAFLTIYENFASNGRDFMGVDESDSQPATFPAGAQPATEPETHHSRIKGDEDAGLVIAFLQNRGYLLPNPVPSPGLWMIAEPIVLRLSNSECTLLDLPALQSDLTKFKPPVSVKDVRIIPGQIYTTSIGGIGYYHQVVMSGAVMDDWIKTGMGALDKQFKDRLKQSIRDETMARKKEKPALTWETAETPAREQWSHWLRGDDVPAPHEVEILQKRPLLLFDRRTLDLYSNGHLSRIQVQRRKATLTVTIPLAEADIKAVLGLFEILRREAADAAKEAGPFSFTNDDCTKREPGVIMDQLLSTMKARHAGEERLEVSIDLKKLVQAVNMLSDRWKLPDQLKWPDEAAARVRAMDNAVRGALTVNDGVKREEIIKRFDHNEIEPVMTESVKPGTGFGEIKDGKKEDE